MTNEQLLYALIRIIVYVILFYFGYKISRKKGVVCMKMFAIPIIIVTLGEGLRWGRGIDYNVYYYTYNEIRDAIDLGGWEPFFFCLMKLFNWFDMPWQAPVLFFSFFLVYSYVRYLKEHRDILMFTLPLFFYNTLMAENLMRWYLAFSVILIGIHYLLDGRWKAFVIFGVIATGFHYMIVLVWLPMLLISNIKKPVLNPSIAVFIFVGSFLVSEFAFQYFSFITDILVVSERFESYRTGFMDWMTEEKDTEYKMSIDHTVANILAIVAGYRMCNKGENIRLTKIYNIFLMGVLVGPFLCKAELTTRIYLLYFVFHVIFVSNLLYERFVLKHKIPRVELLLLTLYILAMVRIVSYDLFYSKQDNVLFIWDANGRDVLM